MSNGAYTGHINRAAKRVKMASSLTLQIAFSLLALLAALIGVLMQNDGLHYADLGEVPDFGGGAFLGGEPGGAFETAKAFYVDLRRYYRQASSTLSRAANFILLSSVLAGVMAGFTANVTIASVLGAFWIAVTVLLLGALARRRSALHGRERALEERRVSYNDRFSRGMTEKMGAEYTNAAFRPIEPFVRLRW